CQQETNWPWTF
nr:immunoglobulin light chain junction region [Macaca mulatta]